MARTPQEIFEHHATALMAGDIDGIVEDYADDALFITSGGVRRGKDGVREAFTTLLGDLPDAAWEVPTQSSRTTSSSSSGPRPRRSPGSGTASTPSSSATASSACRPCATRWSPSARTLRRRSGGPRRAAVGMIAACRRRVRGCCSTGAPPALEVLLGHMGGPFWARKDDAAWSVPKGEYEPGEEPFAVALREFEEELGSPVPADDFLPLGEVRAVRRQGAHGLGGGGRPRRRGRAQQHVHRSSGRRAPAGCRSSPRSTGPPGCPSTRRARSWSAARCRCSTGCSTPSPVSGTTGT